MPLFQKSVLNKFIKSQDSTKIDAAYQRFSDIFLQADRQSEIRSMKEEEYQDGFLDDLFVSILGYIKRPNAGFNLVREKKNEADSKKADGAILKNDSPLAVIELKGTDTTDLDKVTNQGFGYKNNHKECVYVVISNFEKLRFFIHHAVDYIEFNLFTLSKEEFTTLWLCLHSDNLLDNIPAKIKADSVVKEEDITKNLYKDYSSFKQELWQDIVKSNPSGDPLVFYKKTQKLIDRFLFIFFAEDAGLLPPNSISRMVDRWKTLKEEDAYKPLYEIFKQYFGYINTGRPGKTPQDEIFAYNGGLMAEDEVLETVLISDEVLLKHVSRLTTYDFSSEVDVNILGHIFENSLNDIEAVTAQLEGQEIDKSKTKRKKDGVFYTPKYITKYIVDNTVGKLCDEKKAELNIIDEEYAKGRTNRKKETLKKLDENLQAYRNWLLNITICDPACGSGAFLNQALEYLMDEHRYIDELESQLLGAGFTFPGVENHILENNIFGVDINEESIEIAKLSLWLRTAQRGRKLTSLNNNIKCGNSLIDTPEVAGVKAFNWQQEFPTVFEKGGFDVIIGNPPYVNVELMPIIDKDFYKSKYTTFFKRSDLFSLFIELSISQLTSNGRVSFIIPSIVLNNLSYKRIRDLILDNNWLEEVCYTGGKVFDDATVDSTILVLNKGGGFKDICLKNALNFFNPIIQTIPFGYFEKYDNNISVGHGERNGITDKLFSKDFLLCESYFQIFQGVVTGNNDAFIFDTREESKKRGIEDEITFSMCHGRDISKWSINNKRVMAYLDSKTDILRLQGTNLWLSQFYEQLMERRECKNGVIPWFSLQWPREKEQFLHYPKILIQNTRNESLRPRIVATIDDEGLFGTQGLNFIIPTGEIDIYALLGLLNSKLINYLFATKFLNLAIKADYLKKIQFPIGLKSSKIKDLSKDLSEKYKVFNSESTNFIKLIQVKFGLEKISKKLDQWYLLDFATLLSEFKKAKVSLDFNSEEKLMVYFEEKKSFVYNLKTQIDQTDREIDWMVYELYGLTEEEILIVEGNVTAPNSV
jgi:type I restriction-modification system DNA methylase subunit